MRKEDLVWHEEDESIVMEDPRWVEIDLYYESF